MIVPLKHLIHLHIQRIEILLVSDVNEYYEIITVQRQNWKLFPWVIDGTQSVGDDPKEDYYYSTRISAEKYIVYVVYHNFDHDQLESFTLCLIQSKRE